MSTTKLLTGQAIYETAQAVNGNSRITNAWADADTDAQKVYNEVAKRLNEDLGLCESCGERPVAPNCLLEVAGDMVCQECISPPQDDPNVQYMHLISNPDGTLAGVITPPAGVSLEDYQKQLQEEKSHISFVLCYGPGDAEFALCSTFEDLFYTRLYQTRPDQRYVIRVLQDCRIIGHGMYTRQHNGSVSIAEEMGRAHGLQDALNEYALINTQQETQTHAK